MQDAVTRLIAGAARFAYRHGCPSTILNGGYDVGAPLGAVDEPVMVLTIDLGELFRTENSFILGG